jgi:hypothetical protein
MPKAAASNSTSFRPCPEGTSQAILVDVIDLGRITTTYNGETKTAHKINLVWQVDERKDDGSRFLAFQRLTLSLHPKATLRKIAETLRGKKFTEEDAAEGFEVDDLKGSNALLTIVHNEVGDRVYANVSGVANLLKGMKKLDAEPYERRAPKATNEQGTDSDDIPF